MKLGFTWGMVVVALCSGGVFSSPGAQAATVRHQVQETSEKPPTLSADAAILIDSKTGAILYEKNAFQQMDPASLTKMMTALLTIEHGHLDRTVQVSRLADSTIGSSLHIRAGQRYTVSDLLRGLLLRSGNDAAVALAEANAGSVGRFVADMNRKAQAIGAFNTVFENPNGLTAPGHYSSAYDLSLIARTALKNPVFREIVGSHEMKIEERSRGQQRTIHSTNQLLYGFPGADGVKTGTTNAAGRCLVGSATRDGRQLVAVVLKSGNRYGDASRLLNWGFRYWRDETLVRPRTSIATIHVAHGVSTTVNLESRQTITVSLPRDQGAEVVLTVPHQIEAPVRRQSYGWLTVVAPNQPVRKVALWPQHRVAKKALPRRLWQRLFG